MKKRERVREREGEEIRINDKRKNHDDRPLVSAKGKTI